MPLNSNGINPYFDFRLRNSRSPFEKINFNRPAPAFMTEPDTEEIDDFPDMSFLRSSEQGPAASQFFQHLRSAPTRQDYAPSKWRRFAAALAGLGSKDSYGTARSIIDEPYERAYGDWSQRGSGLKAMAELETEDSQKRLNLLVDMLKAKASNRIAKQNADANKTRADNDTTRTRLAADKAPVEIDNLRSQIGERDYRTGTYLPSLVRQGDARVRQGWAGLADADEDRRQRQVFHDDNNSWTNPRNMGALFSGLKGFMPESYAPHYVLPAQQRQLESLATSDLLTAEPWLKDYLDSKSEEPRIDFTDEAFTENPAERDRIRAKLNEFIKKRSGLTYGVQ